MPKEPLSETRMIRASEAQVAQWRVAAEREGYWSLSEWIRTKLGVASGSEAEAEIVGDAKAIAIYRPDRQQDRKPALYELARYDSGDKLLELVFEVSKRDWCTPGVLKSFVIELERVLAAREAKGKGKSRKG